MSHDSSDEGLAKRVQNGEKEFFGVLVERYESKLLRYGRHFLTFQEDIEDIVQDVFVSAYQNILSFDPGQKFSPWIYRIAHNAFVNVLKKHSRNPLVFLDFDTLVPHPAYDDPRAEERDREEIKAMIESSLKELDQKYREILTLYYLEGLDYKEVAEVLRLPTGTVGIRLKRGREALREVYETIHKHERN